MSVTLTEETRALFRRLVDSGAYANEAEAIEAAVALLGRCHPKLDGLREAVQEGLDSGPDEPFDADDVIRRGVERHKASRQT